MANRNLPNTKSGTKTHMRRCGQDSGKSMISSKNNVTVFKSLTAMLATIPLSVSAEWTGRIEGGKVLSDNNGGTGIELTVENNARPFTQEITAEWLQLDSGINSYELGYRPEYWLNDFTYVYGEGALRAFDSLSLDNYRTGLGAGIGIELRNSATEQLTAEIGITQLTTISVATIDNEEFDESTLFTGALVEGYKVLYESFRLELEAEYLTSDLLDIGTAELGIVYKISNGAIKYSYRYINTTIGEGDAITDTDSAISFLYSF